MKWKLLGILAGLSLGTGLTGLGLTGLGCNEPEIKKSLPVADTQMNKNFKSNELGDPLPPWLAYPEIPPLSIGWRMGDGEEHKWVWKDWYESQSTLARTSYRERYPEPRLWKRFYELFSQSPNEQSAAKAYWREIQESQDPQYFLSKEEMRQRGLLGSD